VPIPELIDSHCHLADEAFSQDLEAVVERAQAAGLERALVVLDAGNAQEAEQAARLLTLWPAVRFAIGIHPHNAGAPEADASASLVRAEIARMPAAKAVGEIGLDYHYDYSPRDVQQTVFRAQLAVAREHQLPVVIHTREADEDTVRVLREDPRAEVPGVLHCFTGTASLARAGLDFGLHISLAGIVTFPRAGDLREVAKLVPLDRLLVETDSPFLAPVPHRGKRNEPAYVAQVAAMLAHIHGVSIEEVARRTSDNFRRLFRP
jgi:TatD DNase family protein